MVIELLRVVLIGDAPPARSRRLSLSPTVTSALDATPIDHGYRPHFPPEPPIFAPRDVEAFQDARP
jgi:hypothetical protein